MNILILSSMSNPKFIEDYTLGNALIGLDHKVLVTDINTIDESMDGVYDVVLFRNIAPHGITESKATSSRYMAQISLIPSVSKCYLEYDSTLCERVSKALNIPMVDSVTQGKCMAYLKDFEGRYILEQVDSKCICQELQKKYYHVVMCRDSVVGAYMYDVSDDTYTPIVDIPSEVYAIARYIDSKYMIEIIYSIDMGFRLSYIDTTYVDISTIDVSKVCSTIEDMCIQK